MAIKPLADGALGGIRPGWLSVLHLARQVWAARRGAALDCPVLFCCICRAALRALAAWHPLRATQPRAPFA